MSKKCRVIFFVLSSLSFVILETLFLIGLSKYFNNIGLDIKFLLGQICIIIIDIFSSFVFNKYIKKEQIELYESITDNDKKIVDKLIKNN